MVGRAKVPGGFSDSLVNSENCMRVCLSLVTELPIQSDLKGFLTGKCDSKIIEKVNEDVFHLNEQSNGREAADNAMNHNARCLNSAFRLYGTALTTALASEVKITTFTYERDKSWESEIDRTPSIGLIQHLRFLVGMKFKSLLNESCTSEDRRVNAERSVKTFLASITDVAVRFGHMRWLTPSILAESYIGWMINKNGPFSTVSYPSVFSQFYVEVNDKYIATVKCPGWLPDLAEVKQNGRPKKVRYSRLGYATSFKDGMETKIGICFKPRPSKRRWRLSLLDIIGYTIYSQFQKKETKHTFWYQRRTDALHLLEVLAESYLDIAGQSLKQGSGFLKLMAMMKSLQKSVAHRCQQSSDICFRPWYEPMEVSPKMRLEKTINDLAANRHDRQWIMLQDRVLNTPQLW